MRDHSTYLYQNHTGDYVKIFVDEGSGWKSWLVISSYAGVVEQSPAFKSYNLAEAEAEAVMSRMETQSALVPRRPYKADTPHPIKAEVLNTPTQQAISEVCRDLEEMLLAKNRAYGDSALDPLRIFSTADKVEAIKVRIDDKLSRVLRGQDVIGEDTIKDLIGYLTLLLVARKMEIIV